MKFISGLLFLIFATNAAFAIEPSEVLAGEDVVIGKSYQIASEILGEDREILIALPNGYSDTDQAYPVIYVTEGQWFFSYVSNLTTRLTSRDSMPSSIVVAVKMANPRRFGWLEAGTPKADQFLDFIEKEVIGFTDTNFRTNDRRMLVGWEYGGGFAIHALEERPHIFDAYIASSPFPVDDQAMKFEALKALVATAPETKKSLYFASAEVESMVREGVEKLAALLRVSAPEGLEWQHRIFAGDRTVVEHTTTAYPAFLAGLGHYYSSYRPYRPKDLATYQEQGGVEYAKKYYAKRAERYGTSTEIGPKTVWWLLRKAMEEDNLELFEEVMAAADAFADPWNPNWYARYANYLFEKGRQQAARDMFERTVVEYPTSLRAVFGLAQLYEQIGENPAARDMYQTAVQLAEEQRSSHLENIKSKLRALQ